MIGTYASAALICAVSLLVGRAVLSLAGRDEWSWLEPAVGFGAVLTVTGLLARAPGHGTSATLGLMALVIVAALVLWRFGYRAPGAWREGAPVAVVVLLVLAIPFAVSNRWGLLGVGFNNDLGLHLAWAEWLRSGFGPAPDPGYPLGPHGLAVATAAVPGIGIGQAFLGEIIAIGVMTGLTALGALRDLTPVRRTIAAAMVAVPYLAASYYAQGAFKETAEALLVLAFAILLANIPQQRTKILPGLALAGGIFFSYSFAGIAWPAAILVLWSLTLPAVRSALRPRALLRFLLRPATLIALAALAGIAVLVTLVGPFGFAHSFNKVAGSNTYGPVSPLEALGVWPAANYRLDAAGGADLPGLAGAIAILALLAGVAWWVSRREATIPIALGAGALLYLASLPTSGDYSQAKALIIIAPLAMLVIIRPLLAEFPRLGSRGGGGGGPTRGGGGGAPPPPPPDSSPKRLRCAAGWMGSPSCGVRGRSGVFELPGVAGRSCGAAGAWRGVAGVPADPARAAGALRRPGPLRRLRAARGRHARAAGRVPRPRSLAQPGEAVRHRRRLQPNRLRLLLTGDAGPPFLRDHQPRRLEQPGAA
jgi:hypothetical protein